MNRLKGGYDFMAELHEKQLHYLLKKVKQHEETIA